MVQILQITLRTLEFKNRLAHSSKAQLKLSFGEIEKPFPHPRVIKDDRIKFDGQRMSLSSYAEEQILKGYLYVTVVENGKSLDYGCVEIDILKLKEYKDSSKVSLELENEFYFITLEALSSSFMGGTSEVDNKSQRSESLLSPIRAHSSITPTTIKQALQNVVQFTPKEKQVVKQEEGPHQQIDPKTEIKTEIKRDSEKALMSKTFEFNKKISLGSDSHRLIEEDRKSEISERPVRQSIRRTSKQVPKEQPSREPSITKSSSNILPKRNQEGSSKNIKVATNPVSPVKLPVKKEAKLLVEPPKSIRKIQSETEKPKGKKRDTEGGVASVLHSFEQKDYLRFAAIAVVFFIIGVVFKKM